MTFERLNLDFKFSDSVTEPIERVKITSDEHEHGRRHDGRLVQLLLLELLPVLKLSVDFKLLLGRVVVVFGGVAVVLHGLDHEVDEVVPGASTFAVESIPERGCDDVDKELGLFGLEN